MTQIVRYRLVASVLSAVVLLGLHAAPAMAQAQPTNETHLKDFIHYVRADHKELAIEYAQALLNAGITPIAFADLVDSSGEAQRFDKTVRDALRVAELEDVASKLLSLYESGRLARARDAEEISRNIAMLTGTERQKLLARDRLAAAGEYAAPQLLQALIQQRDPDLQVQVYQLFVHMGAQAVIPLVTALPELDPVSQENVVKLLGSIPYRTSVPFIYELHASASLQAVRETCQRSIVRLDGAVNPTPDLAAMFRSLAEEYYSETRSLTSFHGEEHQLLWSYDPGIGLIPTAIRTEVYHEAMAMRIAEHALKHNAGSADALALWIAANFSREIDSPEAYDNPAYASTRRDAMFHAVLAGSSISELVLARGIDTKDTPLARRAIASIERTAGGSSLWTITDARPALLESLTYPNRRVQYEAALALGAAQPRSAFPGSDRVVPILASAVRDAAARFALVLATDAEEQQRLVASLTAQGYTVLPPARRIADVQGPISEAPGIDLVVSSLSRDATEELIREVRGNPRLAAAPLLALLDRQPYFDLAGKYDHDPLVRIARAGLSDTQVAAAAQELVDRAVGGAISEDEARDYKTRALAVLRDIAVSGNTVLSVADASLPLISALSDHDGDLQIRIADVLAFVNAKRAQVAVADAALAETGDHQVALLGIVADSAKRHGNLLDARHISRLTEVVRTGSDEEATAAAALMGALNLPTSEIIPVILNNQN